MAETPEQNDETSLTDEKLIENFLAFEAMFDDFQQEDWDKYALMHNGELKGVFSTSKDAVSAGNLAFGKGTFTYQQITNVPIYQREHTIGRHVWP